MDLDQRHAAERSLRKRDRQELRRRGVHIPAALLEGVCVCVRVCVCVCL